MQTHGQTEKRREGGRDGRTHGPWLGPSWAQVGQVGTKLGRVGPSGGHVEGQVGQSWGQVGPGGGHVEGILDFPGFSLVFLCFPMFSLVSLDLRDLQNIGLYDLRLVFCYTCNTYWLIS